jgi:hypothetical protein
MLASSEQRITTKMEGIWMVVAEFRPELTLIKN